MEKLNLDSGIRSYRLGSGVLKFNPTDPNLYARFLDAPEKIQALEQRMTEQAKTATAEDALRLLRSLDTEVKAILSQVFSGENDFSQLLGDVNLLALGSNGKRIITNLFDALQPILAEGAKVCAQAEAAKL